MHGSVIEVECFLSISIYVSIVCILLLKFESVLNGSELYDTLDGNDRLDHKLLSFSHNNNDSDVKKKKYYYRNTKGKHYENTLVSALRLNSSVCTLQEPCWL